ncbi:hypothetical protein D3C86_848100 [compost metagenome]
MHAALGGPVQPGQRAHQRRLAGAVGAQQRHHFALPDLQIDAVQHRVGAIAGGEIAHAQDFGRQGGTRRPGPRGGRAARRLVAQIGLTHRGGLLDLGGVALRQFAAGVDGDDVIGHAHHQRHVVLDQQDARAGFGNAPQQPCQPRLVFTRQAGRGFVHQQDVGVGGERAGYLDQPPVHVRQIRGGHVQGAFVAAECQQGARAFADIGGQVAARGQQAAQAAAQHAQRDVVFDAQGVEQLRGLVGAGDAAARHPMGRQSGQRLATQRHGAAGGLVVAAEHVDDGGFARAVGPDQGSHGGGRHRERHGLHRAHAAERHGQRIRLQEPPRPAGGGHGAMAGRQRAAVGAAPPARQQARRAVGRGPQHHKQEGAEEQQPVLLQAGQHLRQQAHHHGAQQGARERAGATDGHRQHEQDGLHEVEIVRGDHAGLRGIESARQADHGGRHHERRRFHRQRVDADRLAGGLAVLDRAHRGAPGAARQQRIARQRGEHGHDGQHGHATVTADAAQRGLRDAHQAVLPAGQRSAFNQRVLDDQAEGNGDHRQVGTFHAQGRHGQQQAERGADQRRGRPGQPEAPPGLAGEDRHGVRADGIKARVAERHLAGQAQEHVQTDAGQRQQRHVAQHEHVVAIDRGGQDQGGGGQHGIERQRQPARCEVLVHQTFLTSACPNRPLGRTANMTITSVKLMIWV